MLQTLKATYHNGTLILKSPFTLPEGTEVELAIHSPQIIPPELEDIDTRQELLRKLVEQMQQNPIPQAAPSFNREMLHERR